MRGEHDIGALNGLARKGSSPHARGAPGEQTDGKPGNGIIPACAGSTASLATALADSTDHPRMRGEHSVSHRAGGQCVGSSPHARGARAARRGRDHHSRIIPACAGSTGDLRAMAAPAGDHPRMRGEHSSDLRRRRPVAGSSPHARGALVTRLRSGCDRRIIPACAGSTSSLCRYS